MLSWVLCSIRVEYDAPGLVGVGGEEGFYVGVMSRKHAFECVAAYYLLGFPLQLVSIHFCSGGSRCQLFFIFFSELLTCVGCGTMMPIINVNSECQLLSPGRMDRLTNATTVSETNNKAVRQK